MSIIRFAAVLCSITVLCAVEGRSQTYEQDTLALRIVLDENQIVAPISAIATVEDGRVTKVDLSRRKVVKLSAQISALTALRSLNLADNLLDSLPGQIWELAGLTQLDVGGNSIGRLDARIGGLKHLLFLGLRSNGLASLPASVFGLEQMETLVLSDNLLDSIPEPVSNLIFLKYLDASGNRLKAIPFIFAAMESLDSLDLRNNRLDGLPDLIRGMRPETSVRLGGNQLCNLSAELQDWANQKDPDWKQLQECGSPVLRAAARRSGYRLSRVSGPGGEAWLRLSLPTGVTGDLGLEIGDCMGRIVAYRNIRAAGDRETLSVPIGKVRGPLWARLRGESDIFAILRVP